MKIEFHELECYEKKFHSTQVPSKYFRFFSWYSSSFVELEYQEKFDFLKIKFQKSDKLLNISQTVVDCIKSGIWLFWQETFH